MKARGFPAPPGWVELGGWTLLVWAAFVAVPIALGGIGLGWDALNHHVYLGWVANAPRFDRDFLAASYQSYTYPYLYWPLYQLVQHGVGGVWAGVVLVSLAVSVVPALWIVSWVLVPGRNWEPLAMRGLAIALALMTGVVLSHLDATPNDLLAAVPLVWSVAWALAAHAPQRPAWFTLRRLALLSGIGAGMAVAFKLSNGPLAVLLPLLWAWMGQGLRERLANVLWGSLATLLAFGLCYGYWGAQLWLHYGNPIYPFHDALVHRWLGGSP